MKKIITVIVMLLFAGMAATAQETTYTKSDFVPGDEIILDDSFEGEKLGEFPLRWDLLDGYALESFFHVRLLTVFKLFHYFRNRLL